MIKKNQIVISVATLYRDVRGKRQYLLVRQTEDSGWELPKVTVRRGESSVRATVRMMFDQSGINARILEEADRFFGSTQVDNKKVEQKTYYYLLLYKSSTDILGFAEYKWLDFQSASRKIGSKRELSAFKKARDLAHDIDKRKQKK